MNKLKIYVNPAGLEHDTGPGHPESTERLKTINELLEKPPFHDCELITCRETGSDVLLYAHPQSYIDKITELTPDEGYADINGEVILCPQSLDAALSAANTLCLAVDDVLEDRCTRAFCAVRPPGHHALAEMPMGFCIFGNIFIGAKHAQIKHGLKKIAIIDFDVHHGNGTDEMTKKAEGILFISSHQSPLWPGSGDPKDDVEGKTLSIPLEPGSDGEPFRKAYEDKVFPALHAFKPELLMVSAGFDAHSADPLAGLNFNESDYEWVTKELGKIADTYCAGKIIAALEGGYDLNALKSSVSTHLKALHES